MRIIMSQYRIDTQSSILSRALSPYDIPCRYAKPTIQSNCSFDTIVVIPP